MEVLVKGVVVVMEVIVKGVVVVISNGGNNGGNTKGKTPFSCRKKEFGWVGVTEESASEKKEGCQGSQSLQSVSKFSVPKFSIFEFSFFAEAEFDSRRNTK